MESFAAIYRLLKQLEIAMDHDEVDITLLSPASLSISQIKLDAIWSMLAENGLVKGVMVHRYISQPAPVVCLSGPRITLKGLEYLQENSLMQKAAGITP